MKVEDLSKIANDLVLLDKQSRLKVAFKLIGSVMLDEQMMDFKGTLSLGDGVEMTVLTRVNIENEH